MGTGLGTVSGSRTLLPSPPLQKCRPRKVPGGIERSLVGRSIERCGTLHPGPKSKPQCGSLEAEPHGASLLGGSQH